MSKKAGGNTIQADEASALEAMFAAEQENWNATQEKMSQSVIYPDPFTILVYSIDDQSCRAQRIYVPSRFGNKRGGGPQGPSRGASGDNNQHQQQRFHPYSDRPIPQGYVCYRCGQKGHLLFVILIIPSDWSA